MPLILAPEVSKQSFRIFSQVIFSKFNIPKSTSIASALISLTIKFLIKLLDEIIFIASSLLEFMIFVSTISTSDWIILIPPYRIFSLFFGKERFWIITLSKLNLLLDKIIDPLPLIPSIIIGLSLDPLNKIEPLENIDESFSKLIFTPSLTIRVLSLGK